MLSSSFFEDDPMALTASTMISQHRERQFNDDKRANVNNRKPRVYASLKPGSAPTVYSLDFLIWLQNNFDEAIAMNEQMKNCNHQWVPEYMVENPTLTRVRCRCGAVMTPAELS